MYRCCCIFVAYLALPLPNSRYSRSRLILVTLHCANDPNPIAQPCTPLLFNLQLSDLSTATQIHIARRLYTKTGGELAKFTPWVITLSRHQMYPLHVARIARLRCTARLWSMQFAVVATIYCQPTSDAYSRQPSNHRTIGKALIHCHGGDHPVYPGCDFDVLVLHF